MKKPLPPPRKLQEHRKAIVAFRDAYQRYLQEDDTARTPIRIDVINAIPAADQAMMVAGCVFSIIDPPAMGSARQTYTGLEATAFIHERPGFQPNGYDPPWYDGIIDMVDLADAKLADMAKASRSLRRRPTFWIDRFLRGLLLIPAYLVGLIVGQPAQKIDASAFGLPLRVLGVAADVGGAYALGQVVGFW